VTAREDEPELQLSISTTCNVNMGDHGERQTTVHENIPGETVEDLVRRVFPNLSSEWAQHDATDKVVLKVIVGRDGRVTGQARRSTKAPF
jgi:hypothetical protein